MAGVGRRHAIARQTTELHDGELTPGAGARIGKVDFDTWFAANEQEARRARHHLGRTRIRRVTSIWRL
jgi:hypothetical protein